MSAAFDAFLNQFNATGSNKADGYSATCFDNMTPDEKLRAFEMLSDEIEAVPQSAQWLFYIDDKKALAVCEPIADKMSQDPYSGSFIIYYYLLANTKNLAFQKKLISLYSTLPEHLKPLAIEHIGKTFATKDLSEFLKSILPTETNDVAVNRAAFHFMRAHAVPSRTEEEKQRYRSNLASLKDKILDVKLRTISSIENAFPIV